MFQRTVSFQYDEDHGVRWYQDWFRGFASRRGLTPVADRTETEVIMTPAQIDPSLIWSPDEIEELREAGIIPLPSDRKERLCRPITFRSQVFEDEAHSFRIAVKSAKHNEFPFLGADLWLEEDMVLPAGFLTVEATNEKDAEAVASEFLTATGRGDTPPEGGSNQGG